MLKVAGVSIPLKLSQLKTVRKRGGKKDEGRSPWRELFPFLHLREAEHLPTECQAALVFIWGISATQQCPEPTCYLLLLRFLDLTTEKPKGEHFWWLSIEQKCGSIHPTPWTGTPGEVCSHVLCLATKPLISKYLQWLYLQLLELLYKSQFHSSPTTPSSV